MTVRSWNHPPNDLILLRLVNYNIIFRPNININIYPDRQSDISPSFRHRFRHPPCQHCRGWCTGICHRCDNVGDASRESWIPHQCRGEVDIQQLMCLALWGLPFLCGNPSIIHFNRMLQKLKHQFWGTSMTMETSICSMKLNYDGDIMYK